MKSDWHLQQPKVGDRARFFHPRTMGVMHHGTVTKVHRDGTVTVHFEVTFNGRHSFRTHPDNIKS